MNFRLTYIGLSFEQPAPSLNCLKQPELNANGACYIMKRYSNSKVFYLNTSFSS